MLEQQGSSQHICCPGCRFRGSYKLADGRRKCRRCGRKYSPKLRRSRLAPMLLKQLALFFWLTVPVATAAEKLGINVKTVRRHYGLMRQGIALERICPAHEPRERAAASEDSLGLCVLVVAEGVRIAAICCEWFCLDSCRPSGSCHFRHIRRELRLPAPLRDIECCLCFLDESTREWTPVCERELTKLNKLSIRLCRMERHRGRLQRALLLKELAFRFNQRNNPGVTAMLYDLMKPVCSSRQKE